MDLRTFLMLLHLCEGIGNANELRVAAFLRIYQRLPTKNELKSQADSAARVRRVS